MNGRALIRYILTTLAIASTLWVGAFALSEALKRVDLNAGEAVYSYTPASNSEYCFNVYSADGGEVYALAEALPEGDAPVFGEGRGELFTLRLTAGKPCRVTLRGRGEALVEMTRCALNRCAANAYALEEEQDRAKLIARPGDQHWYAFTARADGLLLLTCVSDDLPGVDVMLFDGDLNYLDALDETGGAHMLRFNTVSGARYYLRVAAADGATGSYTLGLNRGSFGEPLRFTTDELTLAVGSSFDLADILQGTPLMYASGDYEICHVTQDGRVTALRPGQTDITVSDAATDARLHIRSVFVPMRALSISTQEIRLSAGDSADIPVSIEPADCSDRTLLRISDDEAVARVDADGILHGVSEGETTVSVTAPRSGMTASVRVIVYPAPVRYRALLFAEENYPEGNESTRSGALYSMDAVAAMLRNVRIGTALYAVRTFGDASRTTLTQALRELRTQAAGQDVTLVYLSCHGYYEGGMSFFALSDGTTLSARDLERELRAIPGDIILLLDCCGSGGAIGALSDRPELAAGLCEAFPAAAVRGGKYRVLCSCALDEDSLRVSFAGEGGQTPVSTLFARVLCEGCGWDIDRAARAPLNADENLDGGIDFSELADYMRRRAQTYLTRIGATARQSIQSMPDADGRVIMRRDGDV